MAELEKIGEQSRLARYWNHPLKRYLWRSMVDGTLVVVAAYVALVARFAWQVSLPQFYQLSFWLPPVVLVYVAANYRRRIYDRLWRYATARDVLALAQAVSFATLLLAGVALLWGEERPLALGQILLGGLFTFLLMLTVRLRHHLPARWLRQRQTADHFQSGRVRALIVGAGDHGRRLACHLRDDLIQKQRYEVVGFVDDDPTKLGLRVNGLKVWGTRHQIPTLVREQAIDQIIIASRSPFGDSFRGLVDICQETPAQIKVLPRFYDLLDGRHHVSDLRDLTIEDLLERKPARIDTPACRRILADRTILVTGAAGSIGSELCRQLLRFRPGRLLLVDNNETGLHEIYLELKGKLDSQPPVPLQPLVADITDANKLQAIFSNHMPQIVFHAAAYKHVPMMETHPDEALRVNVTGSLILTQLAAAYDVERFIFISTDKAVNPTSVMGASKRIGERWMAALQQTSQTRFASVRFGNVVGSRGSVVPLFSRQIEQGGPVTITDPRMTRYFMSIPEAATLIIQAGAFARGGEIYMLDMGRPIRIVDLAQKMIRLKGLRPGIDIPVKFVGIRPGEKLHEELSYQMEHKRPTGHPQIYCLENHITASAESMLRQIGLLAAAGHGSQESDAGKLRRAILLAARGDDKGCRQVLQDILPPSVAGRAAVEPVKTAAAGAAFSLNPWIDNHFLGGVT